MRAAICIPARRAAARCADKPLAPLGGLPLVVQVARQAAKAAARRPAVRQVVVATPDAAIYDAAQAHGVAATMTGAHHPSGTDRVAEAVAEGAFDVVLNLQGDEPFVHPDDLVALLDAMQHGSADVATLARPLEAGNAGDADAFADPNVVKVVVGGDGTALYFSRAPIPHPRDGGGVPPGAQAHVGVYAYRRAALSALCRAPPHPLELIEGLEQLRALALGLRIAVLAAKSCGRGIDTPADLTWARARVARLGSRAFP